METVIPVLALHRDPKYYPEPERFDSERFNEDEKTRRHHYVYLPFGEGPRICIGTFTALTYIAIQIVKETTETVCLAYPYIVSYCLLQIQFLLDSSGRHNLRRRYDIIQTLRSTIYETLA
jgi:hypothetical protein